MRYERDGRPHARRAAADRDGRGAADGAARAPARARAASTATRDGSAIVLRGSLTPATRAATRGSAAARTCRPARAARTPGTARSSSSSSVSRSAGRSPARQPITRQRELLARLRVASPHERAWLRERLREHCAEHFPDVTRRDALAPRRTRCAGPAAAKVPHAMRRTKIVATIGPASREPEVLARLVEAGMDVARLNYSHGNLDEHAETAERVRAAASRAGRPVAILQDLPGPKLRIGALRDGIVELAPGRHGDVRVRHRDATATRGACRSAGTSWPRRVEPDAIIYLADGSVRLRVLATRPGGAASSTPRSRSAAPSPRARASTSPGRSTGCRRCPQRDLELLAPRRVDRRRPRRAVVRALGRGRRVRARAHAAAAGREDREAAGGRERRGRAARRGLRDGRARRPRHRAADRGRAARAEAPAEARRRARAAVDHGDADARLDGPLEPARRAPRSPTWPTRSSTAPTP